MRFAWAYIAALLAAGCLGYDEIGASPVAEENHRPYIESAEPAEGVVVAKVNVPKEFKILSIDDPDGDTFFGYRWTLANAEGGRDKVGNGSMYSFTGTSVRIEDLMVEVWDCPGVDINSFAELQKCLDTPPDPQSVVQHRWAIKVEPQG